MSKEHVFPAAIGGSFVIYTICKACNTYLNQRIDEPFNQSRFALLFRELYSLNRSTRRKIRNPLKGVIDPVDDKTYYFEMEGGRAKRRLPTFFHPVKQVEGGFEITVTTDQHSINDQSVFKQIHKKYGIDPGNLKMIKRVETPMPKGPIKVEIEFEPLILECIKIAFETCASLYPSLIQEPEMQNLKAILLNGQIRPEDSYIIDNHFNGAIDDILSEEERNDDSYHGVYFIRTMSSLVAIVKLFSFHFLIEISKNKALLSPIHSIKLVNRWSNGSLVVHFASIDRFEFSFGWNALVEYHKECLDSNDPQIFVRNCNGQVSLFDDKSKLLYDSVEDLFDNLTPQHLFSIQKNGVIRKNFLNNPVFVKLLGSEHLIQVFHISYKVSFPQQLRA